MQKVARRLIVAVLLTFVVVASPIFGTLPAMAHAQLLETSISEGEVLEDAPKEIRLVFNEDVLPVEGTFRIFDSNSSEILLSTSVADSIVVVAVPEELPEGSYVFSYRVVSADGHPVSGTISFSVGEVSVSPPIEILEEEQVIPSTLLLQIFTALQYLLLLWLAGIVFFNAFVLPKDSRINEASKRVDFILKIILLLVSLLLIPITGLRTLGLGVEMIFSLPWVTSVSAQVLIQSGAIIAALVITFIVGSLGASKAKQYIPILAFALALVSLVFVGHTQTVEPVILLMTADIGHVLAGAFWLGGVVSLSRIFVHHNFENQDLIKILYRFSGYAIISAALLALSGFVMAWAITGDLFTTLESSYGVTLSLKLFIVLVVVVIAIYNRFKLLPALKETHESEVSHTRKLLVDSVKMEAALLALVIVITGFLTSLNPHDHSHGHSVDEDTTTEVLVNSQGLRVEGSAVIDHSKNIELIFSLEYEGEIFSGENVEVLALLSEKNVGPIYFDLIADSVSGYRATSRLPVVGFWTITINAKISTFVQPTAVFDLQVD